MKSKTLLAVGAISAALTLTVRADFIDNFDSYANQAALTAVWNQALSGTEMLLDSSGTPAAVSSPNVVKQTTTAASRVGRSAGMGVQANLLNWSFDFFDAGGSRDFNGLYAYTGAWGVGLETALAIGVYNTGTAGHYMGRYSAITGAVFADGAVTTGTAGGGWFTLTGAPRGTGAWHDMQVLGMADPLNAGKTRLEFYVDTVLAGSIGNINSYSLTYAVIGGAVSTTTAGSATDNFSVVTVPEPSTLALSLLGGVGLLWIARRRSA
ncbi:MAG TPA: PEP-CTERM sorting domain-containing protein [Candidatus Paceibacterota bacterium]|nr:PEP-CTERM sorting domain-containing protein [Verrucomicrobiota bacterium]HSA11097.1 PEP-CTERM sorting domain-containing protein [Candidatus Paceibacterota bacterium]